MDKLLKTVKYISFCFAALFCFELVFGYTGTLIMIHSVAIRHILFIPTFLGLYLFCLLYLIKNRIPLFKSKGEKTSVLKSLKVLDWLMLAFVVSTAASLFVIPKLNGGSFQFAKAEALDSLMMLMLYFPIRFMVSWDEIKLSKLTTVLYWLIFGLSTIHIFLYVGEAMAPGFVESFFDVLRNICGSGSITPTVILGHGGYPRVMFSTSIYILVGFYLLLKKLPELKFYDYLVFFVEITAMMTTMTKSIWFGFFGGIAVFTILYCINAIINKRKTAIVQILVLGLCSLMLITAMDKTIFKGMISIRLGNSFNTTYTPQGTDNDDDSDQDEDKTNLMNLDGEGAALSNTIKIEQTKMLLKQWKEHPIFGLGYGSYIEGYLRSEECPFSYEMQLPALIMKIGIVGIGLLASIVLTMIIYLFRKIKGTDLTAKFAWLFLLGSFGLCVQTNPLLLSFTGMSVVLLLLIECHGFVNSEEKETKAVCSVGDNK